MADILKLKKKAADFEAKKQMDKALATYREMIEVYESGDEDPIDIPLYNRVGDLLQKAGNLAEAVSLWERAVDHYAEGGFFNPAIALCNKILRQSPGRAVVYYKLGKISAEKGFKADARQNFLEYAARMQKAGNLDEAFRALKEFADLVPEQEDVRLMLAEQLVKADRKPEAIDQLQIAYAQCMRDRRERDAETVAERMKAIDPSIEPNAGASGGGSKNGGLVFLDLDPSPAHRISVASIDAKRVTKAIAGLDLLDTGMPPAPAPMPVPAPAPVREPERPAAAALDLIIEPTSISEAPSAPAPRGSVVGLETTSMIEDEEAPPAASADIPKLEIVGSATPPSGIPMLDIEPTVEPPTAPSVDIPLLDLVPTATPPLGTGVIELETVDLEPIVEPPTAPSVEIPLLDLAPAPVAVEPPSVGAAEAAAEAEEEAIAEAIAEAAATTDLPMLDLHVEAEAPVEAPTEEPAQEPAQEPEQEPAHEPAQEPAPAPTEASTQAPTATPQTGMRSGDFGSFGVRAETAEPDPFSSFEPLEIESSEGVHSLPLDESYVDTPPSLIEAAPESPLPALAPETSDDLTIIEAPPEARATSTVLAISVESLRDRCEAAPEDWGLRRQLAEALLDDGQREAGVAELESTLAGYERDGDLDTAASVAEEIVRIAPTVIRYHQKRVEFAFRASDRMRLAEAYVELADALVKDGQAAKARVVYQRVLEIAPDDIRAQAALETIADAPPEATPAPRRSTTAVKKPAAAAPAPAKPAAKKPAEDEFVSLGDWLREEEEPKSTRMVVEEKEPTGDEQADFADMLRKFKQGVSDNVDEEDHEAHYDLGVAYKEMGLLDEAISEFQKSLRGPKNRVRAIEALGQCFVEKTQLPVAATILQRALAEPGVTDDSLIGVLYLLGTISEELDLLPDAKKFYERVFAVDIQFRDIGDRLNAVEKRLK